MLRILLHDASASCGAAGPGAEERSALVRGLGRRDRVAVVEFGASARVGVAPCAPGDLPESIPRSAVDPHGTSLASALDAAVGLHTQGRRLEILLATDGLATDSRSAIESAAARLAAAGCASFEVLRRDDASAPGGVAELRGPGAVRAGESFALEARGVARADDTLVELRDEAGVVETRRVAAGAFRLAFARIEESAGPVTYTARVAGSGVPAPVARIAVAEPGRVLVVGSGALRRGLGELLAARPDWCDARDADAARLGVHDVVVVDGLDESRPAGPLVASLAEFARGGGGVVLLGGPQSFGAGGWGGRPIEEISPLVAKPRGDEGAFLYLALDGSGSMLMPWGAAPGAATYDAVVRAAAATLVRMASADTTLALRRFSGELLPPHAAAGTFRLDAAGRAAAERAVEALADPDGSTALLPPLREALKLGSGRGTQRRRAMIFTDGCTPEEWGDLHDALVALDGAGVGVTFVVPGDGALVADARPLSEALAGTRAEVRGAESAERLADVFRSVEAATRSDVVIVSERRLVLDDAAGVLARDGAPAWASTVNRTWLAEGARQLVATDAGEPFAALRQAGLGTVAAIASRPGDDDWMPPVAASARLLDALVRAAARRASGRLRIERDGAPRALIAYEGPSSGEPPAFALARRGEQVVRVPLAAADAGLYAADLPGGAEWIDLLSAQGRVLATAGLDAPAPAEYRDPPRADLAAIAALAGSAPPPRDLPTRPWLAAASAAGIVAALARSRVKSHRGLAR